MVALKVRDLSKRFKKLVAVNDISFDVREGEILGVMGPNGAGKTTLINLISGFIRPDSGKILWKDQNISGFKAFKIARMGIARTFQKARIFPNMSVYDNILVAIHDAIAKATPKDVRIRIGELLDFVEMTEDPSTPASKLTQYDLRKLEIARTLSSGAELILLDEPVSGLTPEESESLVKVIERIRKKGISLLIIEHVMRMLLKVSNRLLVMNGGEKLCEGTPDEIRVDRRVLEAYFGVDDEQPT